MKSFRFLIVVFFFAGAREALAQTSEYNYIITHNLIEEVTDPEDVELGLPLKTDRKSVSYLDGLGRVIQQVNIQQSVGLKDVITPHEYDDAGRETREYLPYSSGNTGAFHTGYLQELSDFYSSTPKVAHTPYFYSDREIEPAATNNIKKQGFPGVYWQLDQHPVNYVILSNNYQDYIRTWFFGQGLGTQCVCYASGFYRAGALNIGKMIDENSHPVIEYKDKIGRIICKETLMEGNTARTYYVYDDFGRLAAVIPPQAEMACCNGDRTVSQITIGADFASVWLYIYNYDKRGRQITKKLPGVDTTTYAYNCRDQVVFEQDGVQRAAQKNLFYKYDLRGRVIQKGLYFNSGLNSQAASQTYIDQGMFEPAEEFVGETSTDICGYTNNAAPDLTNSEEVLQVNYYDNYSFLETGSPLQFAPDNEIGLVACNSFVIGQPTGTYNKILGQLDFLGSATYYDDFYRIVQTREQNTDGMDITSNIYDYEGKLIKSKQTHTWGQQQSTMLYDYVYDHWGRLIQAYLTVNNGRKSLLAQNNYNELDQLIEKNYYAATDNSTVIQSVDYSYNTRGWLTHINSSALNNSSIAVNLDNSLYPEYITGLRLDSITLSVIEVRDSLGDNYLSLSLNDVKDLVLTNINGSHQEGGDEGGKSEIGESDTTYDYNLLRTLSGNTFSFWFNGYEVTEGTGTEEYLAYTTGVVKDKMTSLGYTVSLLLDQVALIVNSFAVARVGFVFFNDDDNDLYGQDLIYPEGFSALGGTPQYNGNISGIKWQTKGLSGVHGYGFDYDESNRLNNANYAKQTASGWTDAADRYSVKNLTYDQNGNILTLERYGCTNYVNNVPQFDGLVDHLSYSYDLNGVSQGNMLKTVNDLVPDRTYTGANDFSDNSSSGADEYGYDVNGNMIRDDNKMITSITYNYMNLPQEIIFANQSSVSYLYDAQGTKLSKTYTPYGGQPVTTEYSNGYVYENGTLSFIEMPEGRITFHQSYPQYEYFLKDHLGNVMVVFCEDPANKGKPMALQQNMFYPFGLEYRGLTSISSGTPNNYKYNGKELQEEEKLQWYDYGARFYDPVLGRWQSVDALGEKMRSWSSYAYAFNNPIRFIDYQGLIPLSQVVANKGISSKFGIRTHPITGKLHGHGGVDFKTDGTGHDVRALADGVVKKIGWNEKFDSDGNKIGYGRYVIIEHKDGYQTLYAHLEKGGVNVKVGDEIKDGAEIGTSGNTGGSTGPHLHVEIGKGDVLNKKNKINPESIDNLQTKLHGEKNQELGSGDMGRNTTVVQDNTYVAPRFDMNALKNLAPGQYKFENGKLVSY